MDSPEFVSKAELLKRLTEAKAQIDAVLARLPATQTETHEGWSAKDLLAHFIAHEQRALEEIRSAARGEHPNVPVADNDAFNLGAVLYSRSQTYQQVTASWDHSFQQVVACVQSLADSDFAPTSRLAELLDDTVDGALANNSYEHYAEHLAELETLASKSRDS